MGESTTDLVWDGHALVFENGELLAESERFRNEAQLVTADIDLDRLRQDRMRQTTFADSAVSAGARLERMRRIVVEGLVPPRTPLRRGINRFPFVPSERATLDDRCAEVFEIQIQGLARRLEASGLRKVVIGVSGGLDSALALIVAAKALDRLGLPRSGILAYTMPGFATGARTKSSAWALMTALGVTAEEIDIRPSCLQMLKDLRHPFAKGEPCYDVTFENVQAGERTSHLFRLANLHGGLVLGTSDLSELALGWCTFGVGDHMSHYNVNASVPKTLVRHLVRWVAGTGRLGDGASEALVRILDTEISPELVPGTDENGGPAQSSESAVGPYALQDFTLYWLTRFGYRPSKIAFLALHAWGDAARGTWPETIPEGERRSYRLSDIRHWLEVFPSPLLREPVQALDRSERPQGRIGRIPLAARRLARAERRARRRLDRRAREEPSGRGFRRSDAGRPAMKDRTVFRSSAGVDRVLRRAFLLSARNAWRTLREEIGR